MPCESFNPVQKEKKRKKEKPTNLVDLMPLYDLHLGAISSSRHNI